MHFVANPDVDADSMKHLMVVAIEIVDVFLVAVVLYLISVGFYTLFIDDTLPLPGWLVIRDIDDLKHNLVGVVNAALGVVYLGAVVSWDGERNLMTLGVGIAAVIVALTFFMMNRDRKHG